MGSESVGTILEKWDFHFHLQWINIAKIKMYALQLHDFPTVLLSKKICELWVELV